MEKGKVLVQLLNSNESKKVQVLNCTSQKNAYFFFANNVT